MRICKDEEYAAAAIVLQAYRPAVNIGQSEFGRDCARFQAVPLDSTFAERAFASEMPSGGADGRRRQTLRQAEHGVRPRDKRLGDGAVLVDHVRDWCPELPER